MSDDVILLAHGSGGLLTHRLISDLFLRHFADPVLAAQQDAAVLESPGERLAFTTDAFVVSPLFFPGGDIGRLAVCGTVNDLAMSGATPRYLSAAFIIEEGLALGVLERIVTAMAEAAREAGVAIVAGDTKVVGRGGTDGMYITTAGVGSISGGKASRTDAIAPGDRLLVSGPVGDHGLAVMAAREGLPFRPAPVSDCAPLGGLVAALLAACSPGEVHALRDPTRGGLAAVANEWASGEGVGIDLVEDAIPVREEVRAACEMLGIDPLHAACEGRLVAAVAPGAAERALRTLQGHPLGAGAAVIGGVTADHPQRVVLTTPLGAHRLLEMPTGELLPRIC